MTFKSARVEEVTETPKVDYQSYPKRDRKQTHRYSEDGFARLVVDPTTYKQAMASLDADSWQSANLAEYQSFQEAGTCTLHDIPDLPAGRQPVGSKWVFLVKHNADGSVELYKAQIVGKGYSQIEGLDYDATFAPVTWYDCLRLIIAVATHLGLDTDQLHIKSRFLNGDILEEIWMAPSPGIGLDGKILRFDKALYGRKQAPLA